MAAPGYRFLGGRASRRHCPSGRVSWKGEGVRTFHMTHGRLQVAAMPGLVRTELGAEERRGRIGP